jgi:hypothetical protein
MNIKLTLLTWTVIGLVVLYAACGGKDPMDILDNNPADAPPAGSTVESNYRINGINQERGQHSSGYFAFGLFKPTQSAMDAAAKGIKRAQEVLAAEYKVSEPGYAGAPIAPMSQYAVVFWKKSPLCESMSFSLNYRKISADDPYDNDGVYDKDPRPLQVSLCVSGKSGNHTWTNGTTYGGSATLHRLDIVEDNYMSEAVSRHETTHVILGDLDPEKYWRTIYHGPEWEEILGKVDAGQSPAPLKGRPATTQTYAHIKGKIDGEDQEFGVILTK